MLNSHSVNYLSFYCLHRNSCPPSEATTSTKHDEDEAADMCVRFVLDNKRFSTVHCNRMLHIVTMTVLWIHCSSSIAIVTLFKLEKCIKPFRLFYCQI